MSSLAIALGLFLAAVPLLVIAFYDAHKHHQRKRYTCGLNPSKDCPCSRSSSASSVSRSWLRWH